MGRTSVRFRRRRLAVVLALLASGVLVAGRAAGGSTEAVSSSGGAPAERYLVRPGDSLWEIARARLGPDADPRPLVADIRGLNGLETSALQVGQILVVPAS